MKISCIIIDDEQHAIDVVTNYCDRVPELQIRSKFTDPTAAAAFIDEYGEEIDLVFLDIEMPGISGIDFLKTYSFKNVILVTAYADYALDSYEYGVVDYLLKPYSFDRFSLAVNKVIEKQAINNADLEDKKNEDRFLDLKVSRQKHIRLPHSEIKYIEGANNYSLIQTDSESIIAPFRLRELLNQLPSDRYIRVHKSYIIHMEYYKSVTDNIIELDGVKRTFCLGPTYKQQFFHFLNKNRR